MEYKKKIKKKGEEKMKEDAYEMYASIFKALAHPKRIMIVELLSKYGELCVCSIAQKLNIDQPSVSKHLNILKNAGIVRSEKKGLTVNYKLQTPCILNSLKCAANIIKEDLKGKFSLSTEIDFEIDEQKIREGD